MNERHLYKAVGYVELNPVAAGMVEAAADWKWSSARAHLQGENDKMVVVAPMLQRVDDWTSCLSEQTVERNIELLQLHERTGRPPGSEKCIDL